MSTLTIRRIDDAKKKAALLVEHTRALLLKNNELEAEVRRLKDSLDEKEQKNEELLNKIKIIKLAQNMGAPGTENPDVKELKRKVNEYIKEIDHCITMLND
ncbi:MAG TPA: hypothetical protein VK174_16545 [Chitinophagales bacterium]|nr:hypothetical protein [Chitinophagales bacterium]